MPFGLRTTISFGESLINPTELREDVRELYFKYKHAFAGYEPDEDDVKENERRFYVYAWFTIDEHKIFYIGKGTGSRYRHIISDMARDKGSRYKELNDLIGIDYEKLADNLTNIEASIYEYCLIQEYTEKGEVLLQFADMPYSREKYLENEQNFRNRTFIPMIKASDYDKRYFGVQDIYEFDAIDGDSFLKTHLFGLSLQNEILLSDEIEEIRRYVISFGGRVFSTLAKGAKSVIEFGIMDYRDYDSLHKSGYKVYHSLQVLEYMKKNPSRGTIQEEPQRATLPKYDPDENKEMTEYLEYIQPKILRLAKENGSDGYMLEQKAIEYEQAKDSKNAIKYFEASALTDSYPYVYERLAIIYRKYGMLKDELRIVSKAASLLDECHRAFFVDREKKILNILRQSQESL